MTDAVKSLGVWPPFRYNSGRHDSKGWFYGIACGDRRARGCRHPVGAGEGPPADPDPNRFAAEIKAFAEWDSRNAVPADPVLFVGSSSIRLWRTHESFPDLPVVNRGFGGSQVSDLLHFADRVVFPYKPSVIVFYAGDNDLAAGKSAQRGLRGLPPVYRACARPPAGERASFFSASNPAAPAGRSGPKREKRTICWRISARAIIASLSSIWAHLFSVRTARPWPTCS